MIQTTGQRPGRRWPVRLLPQQLVSWVRQHGLALSLAMVGLVVAIVIRAKLYSYLGGDLKDAFLGWCNEIDKRGLAQALTASECNYNPAYVYVLWLATKLPFDRGHFLKTFSVLCDFVGAAALAWVVMRASGSKLRGAVAAFAVLVTPTVVFNSALWGQCDMAYAAPLALALAAIIAGRQSLAAALFGLAIAVKLQAVFLFPLLAVRVLRKEVRARTLLLIPATYLATFVPAWLAGASFVDLLMIYPKQAHQYGNLTLNAPTIFALLADEGTWFGPFGVAFAAAVTFMIIVACVYAKTRTTATVLIREAMVFASLTPFLLPHMHERYLFLADVMSVAYCFLFPRRMWVAVCMVLASLTGYTSYLFGKAPISLPVAATMMGLAALVVTLDLLKVHYPGAFVAPAETYKEGPDAPEAAQVERNLRQLRG